MYNHFIPPITLSCLICRHCWHMIRAYQQQNRYLASPWTSGRQNYGAMLPALWKNWTWPSSSWETSGQPAGEPEGCGERVLGIKTLQVDVFGQMLLWLKISTCFFFGGGSMRTMWTEADEFHISWQFCPVWTDDKWFATSTAEVKCSGQRRPVDRFGYRYRSPGHRGGARQHFLEHGRSGWNVMIYFKTF